LKKIFISLFSGAGGLDQGFINAGWKVAFAADNWKPAIDTLVKNHPKVGAHQWDLSKINESDIDDALAAASLKVTDIMCIIGGPPCQAFSRLNQNQLFEDGIETQENLSDPRRSLFMDFLRVVRHVQPPFIVIENVFDLKTRKLGGIGPDNDRLITSVIVEEIEAAGYYVTFDILRAQNYNVPQMRKRMIFIGIRKDINIKPSMPSPVYLNTSVIDEFAKISLEHPNQDRKKHSADWIEKVAHIPQGGYYNHLPLQYKVLKHISNSEALIKVIEQPLVKIVEGCCLKAIDGTYHTGDVPLSLANNAEFFRIMPRMGTYLRRIRETVSHTVTRNPFIHPTENREITVREKAAIQTFPPEYCFVGTIQEQHILVGNAVPCNLGENIANHLKRFYKNGKKQKLPK
jgi:DNA (cytosine-5)-methyltransferase 1